LGTTLDANERICITNEYSIPKSMFIHVTTCGYINYGIVLPTLSFVTNQYHTRTTATPQSNGGHGHNRTETVQRNDPLLEQQRLSLKDYCWLKLDPYPGGIPKQTTAQHNSTTMSDHHAQVLKQLLVTTSKEYPFPIPPRVEIPCADRLNFTNWANMLPVYRSML